MELPMNLAMKRYGANVTLPAMVTLWGMVCACQGQSASAILHYREHHRLMHHRCRKVIWWASRLPILLGRS